MNALDLADWSTSRIAYLRATARKRACGQLTNRERRAIYLLRVGRFQQFSAEYLFGSLEDEVTRYTNKRRARISNKPEPVEEFARHINSGDAGASSAKTYGAPV